MTDAARRIAEIDDEIFQLRFRLAPFAARIGGMEQNLASARNAEAEASAHRDALRKKIISGEEELRYLEAKKVAEAARLDAVASVKAAEAIQKEFEALNTRIGGMEDELLALMEENDSAEKRVRDASLRVTQLADELEAERVAFADAEMRGNQRETILKSEREVKVGELSPDLRKKLAAIASLSRPILLAHDDMCPGCKMKLKPNARVALAAGHPGFCDCGRILVV